MPDVLTPEQRHKNMSAIKGKNTKPEMVIRSLVHKMGYRYRLHRKDLPGKPDMVFPKRKKVIFVHGCFWHIHSCQYGQVKPKTNADFWEQKRQSNVTRDIQNLEKLEQLGWQVFTIWECEVKDTDLLRKKITEFLEA